MSDRFDLGAYGRAMEFLNSGRVDELIAKAPPVQCVVLGLMGYAQSGKDTVAGILEEECGFTRIAFADALREMAYALNPIIGYSPIAPHAVRLREAVDEIGWEKAKVGRAEVRELLQRLGTEAGRQVLGENVWVDAAMRKMHTNVVGEPIGRYVFTDVRFSNEYAAITAHRGYLVRITRPGTGAVNGHASETALDGYAADWTIANESTEDDLRTLVLHWAEKNGWK